MANDVGMPAVIEEADEEALIAELEDNTRKLDRLLAMMRSSTPQAERHAALDKALITIDAINDTLRRAYPQGGFEELSFSWAFNQALGNGISANDDVAGMQAKLAEYADANNQFRRNEVLLKKEVERLEFLMGDMYRRSYKKLMDEGKFPAIDLEKVRESVVSAIRATDKIAPLFDATTYNLSPDGRDYYTELMNKVLVTEIDHDLLASDEAEKDKLVQKTLMAAHKRALEHQGTVINSFANLGQHIQALTAAVDRALKVEGGVEREDYERVVQFCHDVQERAEKIKQLEEIEADLKNAQRFEKKYRAVRRGLRRFGLAIEGLKTEIEMRDNLIAQRDKAIADMESTDKGALFAEVVKLRESKAELDTLLEKLPERLVDEKIDQQKIDALRKREKMRRMGFLTTLGAGALLGSSLTSAFSVAAQAQHMVSFPVLMLIGVGGGALLGNVSHGAHNRGAAIFLGTMMGGMATVLMTMTFSMLDQPSSRARLEEPVHEQTVTDPASALPAPLPK